MIDNLTSDLGNLDTQSSGGSEMRQRGILIVVAVALLVAGAGTVIVIHALHGRGTAQEYSGTIETR